MNLIPPEYKKGLALEAWRRYAFTFGVYLAAVALIAITLLLPSFFFLRLQIENLQDNLATIQKSDDYKKVFSKQRDVEQINRALAAFVGFDKSSIQASALLEEIFSHMTSTDIVISNTAYARGQAPQAPSVAITGKAATRDAFRAFTEELGKSMYVKGIVSPISNLLDQKDISFSITLNLK